MSVMEISHRAQPVLELLERTQEKICRLMGLAVESEISIGIEEESELHHHRNARSIKPNPSRLPAFF